MLYWECAVGKALVDLGASINLLPLSMCWKIGNLKVAPTQMTLQLADRSIIRPYGVVEWCNPTPQGHWIEDFKKIGPEMKEKALGFSWALG